MNLIFITLKIKSNIFNLTTDIQVFKLYQGYG